MGVMLLYYDFIYNCLNKSLKQPHMYKRIIFTIMSNIYCYQLGLTNGRSV